MILCRAGCISHGHNPSLVREDRAEYTALLAMVGGTPTVEGAIEDAVRTGGVDRPRNTSRNL